MSTIVSGPKWREERLGILEKKAFVDNVPAIIRRLLDGCLQYGVSDRPTALEMISPISSLTQVQYCALCSVVQCSM